MKLIVQIPCLNEHDQLAETLAALPRRVPGFDLIEVLVIDDGSTDGTAERAEQLGVHHIVRFPARRGLSAAFMAGLDAALRLGADVIVNTDADNQYCADDVAALVQPILAEHADVVIGDRQVSREPHFTPVKRLLQRWGSLLVSRASGLNVPDCTSGFRALNRNAATRLFVHNRFSYTLESMLQAGDAGLAVESVPVRTNAPVRKSRLFASVQEYLRRNGPVIIRAYSMYHPARTFGVVAAMLFLVGVALVGRFVYYFLAEPGYSGHTQSLVIGVGAVIVAFLTASMAMLGDLIAANRRLTEEILRHVRHMDAGLPRRRERTLFSFDGIHSTGAEPWRSCSETADEIASWTA